MGIGGRSAGPGVSALVVIRQAKPWFLFRRTHVPRCIGVREHIDLAGAWASHTEKDVGLACS